MCGIIGYTGEKQVVPILLQGLERLEYRGYDSAGIAVYSNDGIKVIKAKGRLNNLCNKVKEYNIQSVSGIGHTRWATHGEPSDTNSHPHINMAGDIAIVHNGIIENYRTLKQKLVSKGVVFSSETDTEVIVHLLDYYYNGDMLNAIFEVLGQLQGSFALGIISKDYPDKLFCTRKDSPLVVGKSEHGSFIASDIPAILEYSRDVYLLDDMEVAVLSKDKIDIYDSIGNKVNKEIMHIDWDIKVAEKAGYEHFMMKEMHEEPLALRDTLKPNIDALGDRPILRAQQMPLSDEYVKNLRHISIVACGTAYHAGVVAKAIIERICRVPVEVDIASEFRYRNPIINKDDLVIIISQSGETADTIAAMRESKKKGAVVLAICNVVGSTISREADYVCYTWAGPEIAVASTKAYVSQLMMLYILILDIAEKRGNMTSNQVSEAISELLLLPNKVQKLINDIEKEISRFASTHFDKKSVFYLGRGLDYALALEASLKLKEISYIHSEAYAAGELKHGTIALIEEGTLVVALATQDELMEKTISNITEVRVRGAEVLAIVNEGNEKMAQEADVIWAIPNTLPIFRPILAILPMQMMAYYMALSKGCDIDKPRNLAKSVTVE